MPIVALSFLLACLPLTSSFSFFKFGPHISRSDPFVGNYCIFNPDLDNDAVTVIFAPGPFAALRPLLSLTLCIPSLPIIATLTNSEERHNRSCLSATLYVQLRVFFLSFWTLFTIPLPLAVSLQLLDLNRWSSFLLW